MWFIYADELREHGDRVLALGGIRTVDRETREDHETALALMYTVRDGKVAAVEAFSSFVDARRGAPQAAVARTQIASRLAGGAAGVWWPIRSSKPAGGGNPTRWMVRFHRRSVERNSASRSPDVVPKRRRSRWPLLDKGAW